MFKAVECLGYLNARSADVDVKAIQYEYQRAILEKYVEISADVKRYAVGLTASEKAISDDIHDFGLSFAGQISSIESVYDTTYERLRADFTSYYAQNQQLVLSLADKVQKVDMIKEKYEQGELL